MARQAKPKPKPSARERSRKGYVMVELKDDERAELERIRDRLQADFGDRLGLAGTVRWLIRQHRPRP